MQPSTCGRFYPELLRHGDSTPNWAPTRFVSGLALHVTRLQRNARDVQGHRGSTVLQLLCISSLSPSCCNLALMVETAELTRYILDRDRSIQSNRYGLEKLYDAVVCIYRYVMRDVG
jgi:hypothetical protein